MKDLKQRLIEYSTRNLEERKHWYSPAAEAYNQARPRYPQELLKQVVEIAHLSSNSTILELGCGPAIATIPFATLGCKMVCLEPNPDFYRLAQQNCQSYSNVEIHNLAFEEWELESKKFDAVLAASSFHWISPEIGYPKAAAALHPEGYLILLWNTELKPSYEVYQQLSTIYQAHAPAFEQYENRETQTETGKVIFNGIPGELDYENRETRIETLKGLGELMADSGKFKDCIYGQVESEVTYSVDQYLMLLTTYSHHLKLDPQHKQSLFNDLRHKIEQDFGGNIQLSYFSAFHIAQPA